METSFWQSHCAALCQSLSQKLGLKIYSLSTEYEDSECRFICEQEKIKVELWMHFVSEPYRSFLSEMAPCLNANIEIKYLYIVLSCMVRQRSWHTNIKSLFLYGICSFFAYERRKQRVRTLTENFIKFL